MQDLLSGLQPPIMIGLIIAAILALVAIVFLARRLRGRGGTPDEGLSPSLEGPVDYTSLPLEEEPKGWRERFARLSLAGKILAVLVPLLAILGIIALVLTLQGPGEAPVALDPPEPVSVTVTNATVIRPEPLTVGITVVTTGIGDGQPVTVEMRENGEPFAWLNPEQATDNVRSGRAELQVQRAADAPAPDEGGRYTIVARAPDGTLSEETELQIPEVSGIAASFFGRTQAAVATTATATTEPTARPADTPEPTPEPTATPTPVLPVGPTAGVANGGNVRRLPIRTADNVIGGINAGEQVQLIERTPNGEWYRVRTVRDELGWVSVSLIRVPAGTDVPVAPIVTVFVNGPIYERPDAASTEVDRVNRDEVVQLVQRTAAGDWYEVRNVRDIPGWAPVNLLGIPAEVAAAVPVAP